MTCKEILLTKIYKHKNRSCTVKTYDATSKLKISIFNDIFT